MINMEVKRRYWLTATIAAIVVTVLMGQTVVKDNQVGQPAGNTAFYVRTISGRVFAVPDSSIIIDLSKTPPEVRAVGSGVSSFIDNQVPSGNVDGVNKSFSLSTVPSLGGAGSSLHLHRNGILQKAGTDFNLNGNIITFINAPLTGDMLLASYRI